MIRTNDEAAKSISEIRKSVSAALRLVERGNLSEPEVVYLSTAIPMLKRNLQEVINYYDIWIRVNPCDFNPIELKRDAHTISNSINEIAYLLKREYESRLCA